MADRASAFLSETQTLLGNLDVAQIDAVLELLLDCRSAGRLFLIGNGGGAGHASHAAADFRSVGFQAYAYDNQSEQTARINDSGWEDSTVAWLQSCRLDHFDTLFVFSVGGGTEDTGDPQAVSVNLSRAIRYAVYVMDATVLGIVGEQGGMLEKYATASIVIPTGSTPQVEGIQAVLWHLLMSVL